MNFGSVQFVEKDYPVITSGALPGQTTRVTVHLIYLYLQCSVDFHAQHNPSGSIF